MANFNSQWVEIFRAGEQTDSEGRKRNITPEYLQSVVDNYAADIHEAPAVVGHPADNLPAYGWVRALRVNNGALEAQFADVNEEFEQLVKTGSFKKRSASFYIDGKTAPANRAPYLRHVGFLGAQPPAVKGLRDIQFSEGESLTFDSINFDEGDHSMEDKDIERLSSSFVEKLKAVFGFGKKDDSPASFSEADLNKRIADAAKAAAEAATASFGEKITALETENKALKEAIARQGSTMTRSEIQSFVDGIGNDKLPPALKKGGLVEFMEALSGVDAKITVVSFSEEGGKKVETKTETPLLSWFKEFLSTQKTIVEFGEKYGAFSAQGEDVAAITDPARMQRLRSEMGIPAKEGGK